MHLDPDPIGEHKGWLTIWDYDVYPIARSQNTRIPLLEKQFLFYFFFIQRYATYFEIRGEIFPVDFSSKTI